MLYNIFHCSQVITMRWLCYITFILLYKKVYEMALNKTYKVRKYAKVVSVSKAIMYITLD